jgi:hypothetical protein
VSSIAAAELAAIQINHEVSQARQDMWITLMNSEIGLLDRPVLKCPEGIESVRGIEVVLCRDR